MSLRFYRSFATEMMKMASEPGLKVAARFNEMAIGAHDLSTKNKVDNEYQHARDYAAAAGKGAFTGAAALGLKDKMRGTTASPRAYKAAVGIGAGAMVADRVYRHRKLRKEQGLNKSAMVAAANPHRAFRSPAAALSAGRQTARFDAGTIRDSVGRAPKPVRLAGHKLSN
jgi:hypothetical protein